MLIGRILPEWEDVHVADMAKDPMGVEQWIKGLQTKPRNKDEKPRDLAPKSKLHTRAVLHRMFETRCAGVIWTASAIRWA